MKLMNIVDGMKGMARLIGNGENVEIDALCMDSRKKMGRGAMFFCIPGFTFDGHNYAAQAVEAGVSALVVERELDVDCPQLLVSDARAAAARIAAIFYGHPADEMKLIGITGTKGKTTTSFQVKSILETAGYKVGLIGTVCSMIGDTQIPSTLTTPDHIDFQKLLRQMADAGVQYVVMEVSAHAMALSRLVGVKFAAAAFTNLSQDHFDFFGNMENYCAAKMRLFDREMCEKAVYNGDDERVLAAMSKAEIPHTAYAIRRNSDIFAKNIELIETLGMDVIQTNNFEKLKNANGLYSMKFKGKDMNLRMLYSYDENTETIMLHLFYERDDASKDSYEEHIPIALRRMHDWREV